MSTKGKSLLKEGCAWKWGMSAVLEDASAGCSNRDKVMVCHVLPVNELRLEGDGAGLCRC